jgi:DNA-binding MarR family transcriptional regulator
MTFANHPERQFMQYLRGAGWIKARSLPASGLVEKLLQKGWIEQQQQGPDNEVFLRLTAKGLEAKKSDVPIRGTKADGQPRLKPKS